MPRRFLLVLSLAALLVLPGSSFAKDKDVSWIHIEVLEGGADEATVNVNVPLSLLDVALEIAGENEEFHGGHIRIDHADVSVEQLRRMWSDLRDAGDAEFVTVQEKDESVRISRQGDYVLVHVDDRASGDTKVDMKVPVTMVDAMLSGDGETLNLKGALAELQKMPRGEILTVRDGDERVRIWID